MATNDESTGPGGPTRSENSIRAAKPREKEQSDAQDTRAARPSTSSTDAVPESVRKRFVQVRNKYYFSDGARAFTDRGNRLTTPSENTEVVRSLITIAKAREWNEIIVTGTERFRKEAWFAARLAGLDVRGYKPSEFEQAHLVRTLGRQNGIDAGGTVGVSEARQERTPEDAKAIRRGGLVTGRLTDHGRATYQHDPKAPMSYFVKLETSRGDRTIWGVDLERAMKESLTRPAIGDEVGLRTVRQDTVKVKTPTRDAEGKVLGEREIETRRNRWVIEKREFFEARAEAARTLRDTTVDAKQGVKKHPELVGTYLQVHAAELAAKAIRDPQDRQRFIEQVRSALASSVARGEPLPPVRLRTQPRPPKSPERESAPVRG